MENAKFHVETPRLYLSYFDPNLDSHCDFFLTLYTTPEIAEANGRGFASHLETREDARRNIISSSQDQAKTGYGRYIISLRPLDNSRDFVDIKEDLEKIGLVSLKLRKHPDSPRVPDVGFHLLPQFWGKGYATEAVSSLIEYFERERGLKDLAGYCNVGNENSKKMFRRLGFEERGVRLLKLSGQLEDPGIYGLVWTKAGMNRSLEEYGL